MKGASIWKEKKVFWGERRNEPLSPSLVSVGRVTSLPALGEKKKKRRKEKGEPKIIKREKGGKF